MAIVLWLNITHRLPWFWIKADHPHVFSKCPAIMLPWTLLRGVYYGVLWALCSMVNQSSPKSCICTLSSNKTESATGDLYLLTCHRAVTGGSTISHVPCQQVDDLVRIGPLEDEITIVSESAKVTSATASAIQIAPWGFTDLLVDKSVRRIQLDVELSAHKVDALSLAGLETLEELLTRNGVIQWDSCSFANLPRLKHLLLNCRSIYEEFISFAFGIRVVHFVGCEDVPLQFYCVKCIQDPRINVIRIRPGPPLRRYMVKFSDFHRTNRTQTQDNGSRLTIGKCVPSICSDNMLCRNNVPLQMAQANVGRPLLAVEHAFLLNQLPSLHTLNVSIKVNETYNETTSYVNSSGTSLRPILSQQLMYLPRNHRIWIVVCILIVIVGLLITSFVLIGLTRQRLRHKRAKFVRSHLRQSAILNGITREPPIVLTREIKLGSQEQV